MATSSPSETEMSTPYSSAPPRIATPELHDDPVFDTPPQAHTPLSPQNLFLSAPLNHTTPQSLPGTPQLSHRSVSGGKLREGIKKIFRPPSAQNSMDRSHHPLSATEDTSYRQGDGGHMTKAKRHQRLRIRKLKRRKRRSEKGQYSDDGYTSDPGPSPLEDTSPMPEESSLPPVDMDEDEETDGADSSEGHGQGAESRVDRQRKEIQKKLEKTRTQLEQEKKDYQETQATYLSELEAISGEKSHLRTINRQQKDHIKAIEQNLRKIDKYEKDMALLQEGGAKEGLRGKIEGGLKAPLAGIKKGFNMAGNTLKKGRRYIIRTRSSQGGVEDVEGKIAVELIAEEAEGEEEALVLEESDEVTVSKTTLDELQKQCETVAMHQQEQQGRVTTVEEVVSEIVSKIGQVKDTYERLQEQVNDVIDLHQNAVGELRGQLSQVESATVGKTHDLEDLLHENQSKMEKLESLIHSEIERKAEMEKARNWVMTFVAWAVTFVLHLIAFVLKLSSLLSTRAGALSAVAIVIIAVLLFWMSGSS